MPFPRIQLEGYSIDRTNVLCTIELDTDTLRVEGLGRGRRLAWQGTSTAKLSWDSGGSSPFQGGQAQLIQVTGWLSAEAGNQRIWTCPLPAVTLTYYNGESIPFEVPLDDRDLDALEAVRGPNGLDFSLELSGLVRLTNAESITVPRYNYPGSSYTLRPTEVVPVSSSNSHLRFRVGREKWLALLNSSGIRRDLLELPTPSFPQTADWADILRLMHQAEERFGLGYYEDVLKLSREIAEGIQRVLSTHWNFRKPLQPYHQWAEALGNWLEGEWGSQDGRAKALTALLAAVWTWSSPSHHYGGRAPLKEEAGFAIRIAASLISFTSQLVEATPEVFAVEE